ncbi:MAG TPA: DNA primase DnaG [Candidatus Nanoarchaeia archaeon]|nr:DNA primase DnaG [Candidatus Nanoarchaeia archaeon]
MAKISQVAAKYIVHSTIQIEGVVDRPDVIGAIFGQTEGLLGNDLELRELQRSGKIGRIEVNTSTNQGKTSGEIIIPSSLDKTETVIVAAALEIIQRIGPCNAKIEVNRVEDVRISKRQFVVERAKVLLKSLTQDTLPDSQELADEVAQSVRMMEVSEYGIEKLASGPVIDEAEEIIIVEGRADVLNLLKHGFKNAIALNGTSIPETVKKLARQKTSVVFVDGDRGGNLIIRELLAVTDIDFVCKAPDGKEVEELTKKEIHKALRGRITAEQSKLDLGVRDDGTLKEEPILRNSLRPAIKPIPNRVELNNRRPNGPSKFVKLEKGPIATLVSEAEKATFKQTMEDLFGTHGACIFDQSLNVLGKVPLSELGTTIKSLNSGVYALVLDGQVDLELMRLAERVGVQHIIGTNSLVKGPQRINVMTDEML